MQVTYTPKNYSPKMQLVLLQTNYLLTKNAATYYIYPKLIEGISPCS